MDELTTVQEENVFADEAENLFEEADDTTEVSENEAEEPVEVPKSFLKVKYNGEDRDLNEDEARTFAQKGMNYDRIYDPIERLARMNNLSVGDYINQLNDTQIQFEVSKEVDSMREDPKYEGVSDEILEEIAKSHVMENVSLQDKKYEEQMKNDADAHEKAIQKEVDMFIREYPEFKEKGPDGLDPKVFEYTKQGYTLLEAYNKFLRENPSQNVSKMNEDNKRRSLGNTTNAGKVETDDFLKGFLNG